MLDWRRDHRLKQRSFADVETWGGVDTTMSVQSIVYMHEADGASHQASRGRSGPLGGGQA